MKRFLCLILTALLLFSCTTALAASTSLIRDAGSITAVDAAAKQITVTLRNGSTMVYTINDATVLLSAKDGSALTLSGLRAGMTFTALRGEPTTRSIPAQAYLHTLIAAASAQEDFTHDFTVQSAATGNGMTELVNDKGDLILRLSASTDIRLLTASGHRKASAQDIGAGAQLIAWYEVVMPSYPNQAGPSKVLILSAGKTAGGAPVPPDPTQPAPPATGGASEPAGYILMALAGLTFLAAGYKTKKRQNG